MNAEKAREFFSAYHEGTLEGGLKQTFEQKLKADANVRRDYESFVEAMEALDALKFEEIPVPLYLNARILDRLDEARRPSKEKRGLVYYLPRFTLAAAAAAAIIFTGASLLKPSHSNVAISGPFGQGGATEDPAPQTTTWPSESIGVEPKGSSVIIHYSSASDRTVTISDETGAIRQQDALKVSERFTSELKNPNTQAAVFEVKVSDSGPDEYIVVPGTIRVQTASDQNGTVLEFEKALANRYGKAVIFAGKDSTTAVNWNLTQPDLKSAVDAALAGTQLVNSINSNDVLSITDRQ